jgi:hypothetical protein
MRAYPVFVTLALLSSGCLTVAQDPAALTEGQRLQDEGNALLEESRARIACPEGHPYLIDVKSIQTGGDGTSSFEVRGSCDLVIDLDVSTVVGSLTVLVEGPEGPIVEYRSTGARAQGVEASPSTVQRVHQGAVAPGTYTYTFDAGAVADFAISILGE